MIVRVTVPIRTVSEANRRDHWAVKSKRAKEQRWAVAGVLHRQCEVELPAIVTLTRIAPRMLDDDNLRSALKACRDQVADELGLPNDRDARVTWRYEQLKGRPKEYAVQIEVSQRGFCRACGAE